MHVGLRIVLDAPVDAARDALLRPSVMVAVTKPFLVYRSLDPAGFPEHWTPHQPHPISASTFGLVPSGSSHVDIDLHQTDGVPVQVDRGGGTSGLFARMDMRHRMAVSALPRRPDPVPRPPDLPHAPRAPRRRALARHVGHLAVAGVPDARTRPHLAGVSVRSMT
ncbi:hypothetical protein [Curtobacterium sp. MCPF17_052]|uniref:hypothetical protein n=1 Tax=Curtobacterium sp. MCPF17_052 TaxID=2175655 RepID=UPI0024DFD6F5|nr:hypothetical protein [Curtobacterium sp. MCPF17_052]WIB13739.1 hypothetical protein DEJ36_08710 [Curtobacterium sp. MCPF17_052]